MEAAQTVKNIIGPTKLAYEFGNASYMPSFNPKASDITYNTTHMDHLVGTLVKYGLRGYAEPYLAHSWLSKENGKTWIFSLSKGLRCEDGTIIDAKKYVVNLSRLFKFLSKNDKMPDFNLLIGWKSFVLGKEKVPKGLFSDKNDIIFKFERSPSSNFLDLLSQPYFGFFCPSNWEGNKWKDDLKISSSGPYRVSSASKNYVHLEKRKDWQLNNKYAPDQVILKDFEPKNFNQKAAPPKSIVAFGVKPELINSPQAGYSLVMGPRYILVALVIAHLKNGPFKNVKNRRILLNRVRAYQKSHNEGLDSNFYLNFPGNWKDQVISPDFDFSFGSSVNFASLGGGDKYIEMVRSFIKPIKIEKELFQTKQQIPFDQKSKIMDGKDFDLRIMSVDTGGELLPAVIDFMFCTKMGVRFPDPSSKICQVTQRYNNQLNFDSQAYAKEFNQALYEDAFVIPLGHEGVKWLYSQDIDLKTISPITLYPRFDLLKFKN